MNARRAAPTGISVRCTALGALTTSLSLLVIALRPLPARWRRPVVRRWWCCLLRWQELARDADESVGVPEPEPEIPAGIGWRRPAPEDGCYVGTSRRESATLRWREGEPARRPSERLAAFRDRGQATPVDHV